MLTCYVGITYFSRLVTQPVADLTLVISLIPTVPPTVFFSGDYYKAHLNYIVSQFATQIKNHWHFNKLLKV